MNSFESLKEFLSQKKLKEFRYSKKKKKKNLKQET